VDHYNEHRPHRTLGQLPPLAMGHRLQSMIRIQQSCAAVTPSSV
jgi:transposase InsO family protein